MAMPPGPPLTPIVPFHDQQNNPFNFTGPPAPPAPPPANGLPFKQPIRKRKKLNDEDRPEPRRLKRTYESCARCRSKKIKCDNNSPRCKNCADSNVDCQQEDRANKTLKLRGHEELLQAQLNCCVALLQKQWPYFELRRLDKFVENEGVYVSEEDADALRKSAQVLSGLNPSPRVRPRPPLAPDSTPGGPPADERDDMSADEGFGPSPYPPYPPPPPAAYPLTYPGSADSPVGHPPFGPPTRFHHPYPGFPVGTPGGPGVDLRGQDPRGNDLSTGAAAARSFGVDKILTPFVPRVTADEEFSTDPSLRRHDNIGDDPALNSPINPSQWLVRPLIKSNTTEQLSVYLPKNRSEVARLVDVYFQRLNHLRPVFSSRAEFDNRLKEEYELMDHFMAFNRLVRDDNPRQEDDPGFLCSVYLILALSRMAEIAADRQDAKKTDLYTFPVPTHFFTRAVNIKPELRVTISSLQALVLLQWYLYTERHGRTLWRLVGNLVRLAIELGLHHDPSDSGATFKPEEAQLRRRLWWIVMVQDRGTSVLLGRPLAIGEEDFNTKEPEIDPHNPGSHFDLGLTVTHVQAAIVNKLYRPGKLEADELLKYAQEINDQLIHVRDTLPPEYHFFLRDTENWSEPQKMVLMANMNQEQGLTLLKYMIARILLLRAIFTSDELSTENKRKALKDAVITAHNVVVIHSQLLQFTDCAFFVSPIPIHIAAMVIIYARSHPRVLGEYSPIPVHIAREDVSMALRMIPQFRWRWGRRDAHGGHPLMNVLAEKVFGQLLYAYGPPAAPMLISERHFNEPDDPLDFAHSNPISPTEYSPSERNPNFPPLFLGSGAPVNGPAATPIDPHLLFGDWRASMAAAYMPDPQNHLDEAGAGVNDYANHSWHGMQPYPPGEHGGAWNEFRGVNEEWMPQEQPAA